DHARARPARMNGVFQLTRIPLLYRSLEALPIVRATQQGGYPLAVVGEASMEVNPASVLRLVDVAPLSPDSRRRGLSLRRRHFAPEVPVAPHRRRRGIDADRNLLLPPGPQLPKSGGAQAGGGDRGRSNLTDTQG